MMVVGLRNLSKTFGFTGTWCEEFSTEWISKIVKYRLSFAISLSHISSLVFLYPRVNFLYPRMPLLISLLFYVRLENISLNMRLRHCRWRAAKCKKSMFGAQSLFVMWSRFVWRGGGGVVTDRAPWDTLFDYKCTNVAKRSAIIQLPYFIYL